MSYDEQDAAYDDFIEKLSNDLYPDHRDQAISEFTTKCLQRFYLANREVLNGPLVLLREAQSLADSHPAAALTFAFASMESLLKSALLRPIVAGLVHSESLAEILANFLLGRLTGLDRMKKLLLPIVEEHGGFVLTSFKREGSNKTLWEEMVAVEKVRNAVLHGGDFSDATGLLSVAIPLAWFAIDEIFLAVLDEVGLHIHDESICEIPGTKICPDKPRPSVPSKPPTPSAGLSEFRWYVSRQEPSLASSLSLGEQTELELHGDELVIRSRYNFLVERSKGLLEKLASDLYRRPTTVRFQD